MKRLFRHGVPLIIAGIALVGCSTIDGAVRNYKKLQPQKAFAGVVLGDGRWAAGWAEGYYDIAKAKRLALEKCAEQAIKLGMSVRCKVMYENDTPVTGDDREPEAADQDPAWLHAWAHRKQPEEPRVEVSPPEPPKPQPPPPPASPPKPATPATSTGSGAFVTSDGLVLTAEHVIRGAKYIEVLTPDGRRLRVRVKTASQRLDLAILETGAPAPAFLPVRLMHVAAGAKVFTVGYPVPGVLGQEPKVSDGIVNAASGIQDDAGIMQISIPIQPGNSGGPVVTEDGRLIGVVTSSAAIAPFLAATGTVPQNVNWAVHSSLAISLLGTEGPAGQSLTRDQAIARAIKASVLVIAQED